MNQFWVLFIGMITRNAASLFSWIKNLLSLRRDKRKVWMALHSFQQDGLCRYQSVEAISKRAKLPRARVEEVCYKHDFIEEHPVDALWQTKPGEYRYR